MSVLLKCYAKVNLTLEVLRRRPDGFHDLASLVHTISLSDDLRIEVNDSMVTRTTGLEIEPDANLVSRAATKLAEETGTKLGAELTLSKHIPAAAGLGGGSSNAAATLVGLNELWGTGLAESKLSRLAGELGSDVPFFLRGGAALMEGRGECLTGLPAIERQWLVLVVPRHEVRNKTARLYGALEPSDLTSGAATERTCARLRRGEALHEADLVNGFARAARAVFPGLDDVWRAAEAIGQRRFFLSGAGPSVFALAVGQDEAAQLAERLAELGQPTFAAHTVHHARTSSGNGASTRIGYP